MQPASRSLGRLAKTGLPRNTLPQECGGPGMLMTAACHSTAVTDKEPHKRSGQSHKPPSSCEAGNPHSTSSRPRITSRRRGCYTRPRSTPCLPLRSPLLLAGVSGVGFAVCSLFFLLPTSGQNLVWNASPAKSLHSSCACGCKGSQQVCPWGGASTGSQGWAALFCRSRGTREGPLQLPTSGTATLSHLPHPSRPPRVGTKEISSAPHMSQNMGIQCSEASCCFLCSFWLQSSAPSLKNSVLLPGRKRRALLKIYTGSSSEEGP